MPLVRRWACGTAEQHQLHQQPQHKDLRQAIPISISSIGSRSITEAQVSRHLLLGKNRFAQTMLPLGLVRYRTSTSSTSSTSTSKRKRHPHQHQWCRPELVQPRTGQEP